MSSLPLHESAGWSSEEPLVAAMLEPSFYPKPPPVVTHRETHISHIFFAGDLVYKIKKPVRFSFLDFSTLAKRRHCLQEELRLNRRLAPSVYLGVLPIALDESGWRLGGWAEPVEYTLVMRRLPAKRMLPFLLDTNQIRTPMMADLAKLLARFHAGAEIVRDIDPEPYVKDLESQWDENLAEVECYAPGADEQEACRQIRNFGQECFAAHGDLMARRAREGWVRDVHGDLHAEHVCFAPEGIQVFDCIEFDPRLRRCDLAADIGFLSMDLRVRGAECWVEPFLAAYRAQTGDFAMMQLLPFFECYRAVVRAKVHALRSNHWNDDTARYLRFARCVTWASLKPFIVLVCGLTGSGKSTLSRMLAERVGLTMINSDGVRKRVAGISGRQFAPVNGGIYSSRMTDKTYAAMIREADRQVMSGKGVILDATFSRRAHRDKVVQLANRRGVPLLLIHCTASEDVIEQRLRWRTAQGTDVSDARWDIYAAQKAAADPIHEIAESHRLELVTDLPPAELAVTCERFLQSRLTR